MSYFRVGSTTLYDCVDPSAIALEPLHPFSMRFFGMLNSMILTRGDKPGECHLLLTKSVLDALVPTGTTIFKIEVSDGTNTITTEGWLLEHVEAITQATDDNQLYYVCFRDVRAANHRLAYTPASVIGDTWEEKEDGWPSDATPTWATVIDAYFQSIPSALRMSSSSTPSLPFTPASTPRNIVCHGDRTWACLTRVLAACGMIGTYEPVSKTYKFLQADGTQSGLASLYSTWASRLLWDSESPTHLNAANAPATVRVHFQPSRRSVVQQPGAFGYAETIATGATNALTGTEVGFTDTTRVRYAPDVSTILNSSDLTNRATDLKKTVLGRTRAASTKTMKVYTGAAPFECGEEVSRVVYKYTKLHGLVTMVENYEPFEILLPEVVNKQSDIARIAIAITGAGGITARSGTTIGTGTATLCGIDLVSLSTEYQVNVKNIMCRAVAENVYVLVVQNFIDGEWIMVPQGINNLRLDGANFQYFMDCAWNTWITGTTCPS